MLFCKPEAQNLPPAKGIDNQPLSESRSGGQTGSAFGSAASEDLTTFFGGHTSTKAMGACALDSAGLKCTFHGNSWSNVKMSSNCRTDYINPYQEQEDTKKRADSIQFARVKQFNSLAVFNQKIYSTSGNSPTSYPQAIHKTSKTIFCRIFLQLVSQFHVSPRKYLKDIYKILINPKVKFLLPCG